MATDNLDPNATQPQKIKRSRRAKVTVELNKYKTLIDALEDRHRVRRVVLTVFVLGMLLFIGISFITLSIKRLYPYSDITTNGLGATTIKSEKNEVTYWLFNTATLWANSGIHVDKGDIIMVRASGKCNTAIHHLYDATKDNSEAAGPKKDSYHEWIGCEGLPLDQEKGRGKERRKYRIFPDMPSGALLMQVSNGKLFDTPLDKDAEPQNFYFIGKERQHVYINEGGDLYFAVNDIVLNRPTIAKMMWETICEKYNNNIDDETKMEIKKNYDHNGKNSKKIDKYLYDKNIRKIEELIEKDEYLRDAIKKTFNTVFEEDIIDANKKDSTMKHHFSLLLDSINYSNFKTVLELNKRDSTVLELNKRDSTLLFDSFKKHYELAVKESFRKIGKMEFGYSRVKNDTTKQDSLVCELSYYYGKDQNDNDKRKAIWFEDNIGSFLIVIEKTK